MSQLDIPLLGFKYYKVRVACYIWFYIYIEIYKLSGGFSLGSAESKRILRIGKEVMKSAEALIGIAAVVLVMIMISPEVAANGYINSGTSFTFTTSDGGNGSGDGYPFQQGFNYPGINRVEAMASSPSAGGKEGYANVWHVIDCGYTGDYKVEMWGHYWGSGSAAGVVSDALVRFFIRIEDIDSGFVYNSATIRRLEAIGFWAFNEQNNFYSSMTFYGYDTHTYRIGLDAFVTTVGVVGSAIADAAGGDQGAYFTHGRVSPYTPPSGGGCILGSSQVTMADGSVIMASQVNTGDSILGYDVSNYQTVSETVLSNTKSHVDTVIDFNEGLLLTTPLDQPIYARNSTFTGWVKDPMNLSVGWEIYSPLSHSWTEIRSMEYKIGNYKVYDIRTDTYNNYIANGLLVDSKTPWT